MNCPNCQAEMFSAKMTTGFAGVYLYTKDPGILELFFLTVPKEPFLLDMLSVYALKDANSCEILHKIQLS